MEKIAFFGKIPTSPEFTGRGLNCEISDLLAKWIGNQLVCKKSSSINESNNEIRAWRFYISPELMNGVGLMGVMLRSRDSVGRDYPFLLVHEATSDLLIQADLTGWFDRIADIAEGTVLNHLSIQQLEILLERLPILMDAANKEDALLTRRLVHEWGGITCATPHALPATSAISFFTRNLAALGIERLFVGSSVWWQKSSDGSCCEFIHTPRLPIVNDFQNLDSPW
ncbi:type VI secretion system-associated protein TagF [Chitinibacter sp. FCG-7]|uniref:Type VI secretion system-associated protein TagF n=1 Tax=Chitinibacter mangrovi TaxID=3153927 RepID=A0AAU7FAG5_9NEIS